MTEQQLPQLSREIDQLGRACGNIISQKAGPASLDLVERLRQLVRQLHQGKEKAYGQIQDLLAGLDEQQVKVVTRGFTIFLELSNMAEDRQRIRVLRSRQRDAHPEPARETVRAAIAEYHLQGLSSTEVQRYVDGLKIELVLTAHPTEAKRRAVRRLLADVRAVLDEGDAADLLPTEEHQLNERLTAGLSKLWQTDFIRPWRPTVMQEVERGLNVKPILWREVPRILNDLRDALAEYYPDVTLPQHPVLTYGSWIGGDRDGNPFVTPEVTRDTIAYMRREALNSHLECCEKIAKSLSLSDRQTPAAACLVDAVSSAGHRWPMLEERLAKLPPLEAYRRWLYVVHWRLSQTALARPGDATGEIAGTYASAEQLYADVELIAKSLRQTGNANLVRTDVQPWLDQIKIFGLQIARLDVRQDSSVYRAVIDEIFSTSGLAPEMATLAEPARRQALVDAMGVEVSLDVEQLSAPAQETLELFRLLRRVYRAYGDSAIGGHVLSMTRVPSDLLAIMWFWRWSETVDGGDTRDESMLLPIMPLFETIDDLQQSPQTMRELLAEPTYREYVSRQGDKQVVMIGYSDSTKDGGYLAAQWALQSSQSELVRVARNFGIELSFFHGRGGSLARGGGPAAKGVMSLPRDAFRGALRITEQGEVLADRYDNPHIAHRHLEQLLWSVLTAVSRSEEPLPDIWAATVADLASRSWKAYRELVDHPTFADFYRSVTPINAIERLPIGSRPSKRKTGNRIEDLRAIPWVYSWTQCRALLPAWYGLGSALESFLAENDEHLTLLKTMYAQWPFFQITLDNAAHALAQANMPVFQWYSQLGTKIDGNQELADSILAEHTRTSKTVLQVIGSEALLARTPWLERSIKARNGYVDPLNLLQCEMLHRAATSAGSTAVEMEHLIHLTIKGISTGMRTTG